ncbi:GNAT family N-acetyltransferase [Microbacterium sp. Bi128]|uniref:GNAT family N-acetyltransferase n=1 Tax=Microbacterium sp. Bi128 TaxID=2821115 RepID=UPI001DFF08C6|nr:GNAT family N-acetyltransferase [Microbacterium sp. Bi128]CAH0318501.1 putative N-acetyltransferase Rv2669 [Microbacterium sp. Bi128]
MEYQIRQAAVEDADAVVRMHTLAHEECYGHLLSPAFFDARRASMPLRVEKRRPYLDSAQPRIIAMDESNEIVGFADAGTGRDDDLPGELELYSIYTLRRTHGTGLGVALLKAALGDLPAYLWVLEANVRAQAFYVKNGFQPDGTRKLLSPEWEELPEIRMVRSDI